jgi:hypothetical protein
MARVWLVRVTSVNGGDLWEVCQGRVGSIHGRSVGTDAQNGAGVPLLQAAVTPRSVSTRVGFPGVHAAGGPTGAFHLGLQGPRGGLGWARQCGAG